MTGPLEFVEAAHKQAEEIARAATPGPWAPEDPWLSDVVTSALLGRVADCSLGTGYRAQAIQDARRITLHDPAAVLRRIATERKILAEHADDGYGDCVRCADDHQGYCECGDVSFNGRHLRDELPYPCLTVRALAEGWGWTEEKQ